MDKTYSAPKNFPHYDSMEPDDLCMEFENKLKRPSSDFNYEYKFVDLLDGVNTAYIDQGEGNPIVFVHGATEQVYIWRNIMPFVEKYGRVVAMDNLGHGLTDKSDTDNIFEDSYALFEAFMDKLALTNVTLVIQDWGSVIGLYWASKHPERVAGIAMAESLCAPAYPIMDLEAARNNPSKKIAVDHYDLYRSEEGVKLVHDQNLMIERVWHMHCRRKLSERELDTYRAPFAKPEWRKPLLEWPRAVGLGGDRPFVDTAMQEMNEWMLNTQTPFLDIYGFPGAVTTEQDVQWRAERIENHESSYVGVTNHFIQEDQPEAFGRALGDWYRRNISGNRKSWFTNARNPMETVGSFFGAVLNGEIELALSMIHPECQWTYQGPECIPFTGTFVGPQGVGEYLMKFNTACEIVEFDPEFTLKGEKVIIQAKEHNRGRQSGKEIHLELTQVFEIRDGMIIKFNEYADTDKMASLFK